MNTIKEAVQQKYGEAALNARSGAAKAGCGCGTSCGPDPITSNLYDDTQAAGVPAEALLASLGCGNPTALAELKAGEVVLDLGSGGGIDVLLSARRVGPTGKAYGLDMTDEMLALARTSGIRRSRFDHASSRAACTGSRGRPSARGSTLVPPPGTKATGTSSSRPLTTSLKAPSPPKT